MITVKPFKGWHYNPQKVSIDRVIAPPYDVINERERQLLHERDPHNVIRLILGQASAEEIERDERYEEAGKYLASWVKDDIICQDTSPGFYLYESRYKHPCRDQELVRLSVFALLRLEPFERKIVFPHEQTHASPKADRVKLLRATSANFSPIFILYEDPTETIDTARAVCETREPLFDFEIGNGRDRSLQSEGEFVRHRLWFISGEEEAKIQSTFDRRRFFIADGHHRYETALRYAEEIRGRAGRRGDESWNYVLATFVRFTDPGLLILPIHRVLLAGAGQTKLAFDGKRFLDGLNRNFVLHSVSRSVLDKVSEGSLAGGFGVALSASECYLVEIKDMTTARGLMPAGKPASWYELDVNLVSHLVLEPLFGIQGKRLETFIHYTPSLEQAFGLLDTKRAHCAFVAHPVDAQKIKAFCESGELMPQKSTYFFPKFPSGLVVYRH